MSDTKQRVLQETLQLLRPSAAPLLYADIGSAPGQLKEADVVRASSPQKLDLQIREHIRSILAVLKQLAQTQGFIRTR